MAYERIREILGYKKETEKLKSVCDFLKNTEKYVEFGVELPYALLICGKKGVGKSLFADAVTIDCEREIFPVFFNDFYAKNKISRIYDDARKSAHSIVVIDDIDVFDKSRFFRKYVRLINEIYKCKNGEVFTVITATDKDKLPDFFLKEMEREIIIELSPPTVDDAREIFSPIFSKDKVDTDFNLDDLCRLFQDYTYSEASRRFNEAARIAVRERASRVSMRHLVQADLLLEGSEPTEQFDIAAAYHEAGHAAVHLLLGGQGSLTVLADGGGAFVAVHDKITTFADRERDYTVGLAGKACEEIYTGTSSIGSCRDLEKCAEMIKEDVKTSAKEGFEFFDTTQADSPAYNDLIAKKVQSEMQKYYDRAKELIIQNRPLIDALVDGLRGKFYLLHSEMNEIYDNYSAAVKK